MKLKIGLDLDGVVVDYHSYFIKYVNQVYSKKLTLEDWRDYLFSNSGLTFRTVKDIIRFHSKNGDFFDCDPIKNAVEGVRELKKKNLICILTHREHGAEEDAIKWLRKYEIPYDTISFLKEKGLLAYKLGLDIMIDDTPRVVLEMANYGIKSLLFDRPWNLEVEENPLIQRVKSWEEIYDILK